MSIDERKREQKGRKEIRYEGGSEGKERKTHRKIGVKE